IVGDAAALGNLQEGDTFTLLQSDVAPVNGQDRFDLVVLPGLPNGLAGELEYSSTLAGAWNLNLNIVSLSGLLNFDGPNSVSVTGEPTAVEVVDLTGDGAEEICVTFYGSPGQLVIFENDGSGGISQQVVFSTGDGPLDVSSEDFDSDGLMDLAVANNLSGDVTLYYNDGDLLDGMTEVTLATGGPPTCLAGVQADTDGVGDLVVGVADTDGDGNGAWELYFGVDASSLVTGGMPFGGSNPSIGDPIFGDPSEDEGQKDGVFIGGTSTGRVAVGKGSSVPGIQGFTLTVDFYVAGSNLRSGTMADLNGDSIDDIVVSSEDNDSLAVLLADPTTGIYQAPLQIPVGESPASLTSVDFDQDGNSDIAVIVQEDGESRVRVLQSNGALSFTSVDTAIGENVILVDAGDVSGDGLNELVTIGGGNQLLGFDTPSLSLRPLSSSITCTGDLDGDGSVTIDDLLITLGEFGPCPAGCSGDLDQDGDVDINDLLQVIAGWGPCTPLVD
ncbi:MAG: VCBS repeat-containing protein, partial [Phycisphaerales bacterium]|nr:VCBS repeat-containing protein [Phycisphaerales bacterium]